MRLLIAAVPVLHPQTRTTFSAVFQFCSSNSSVRRVIFRIGTKRRKQMLALGRRWGTLLYLKFWRFCNCVKVFYDDRPQSECPQAAWASINGRRFSRKRGRRPSGGVALATVRNLRLHLAASWPAECRVRHFGSARGWLSKFAVCTTRPPAARTFSARAGNFRKYSQRLQKFFGCFSNARLHSKGKT